MKRLYKYTLEEDFSRYYPQLKNVRFRKYWKDSKGNQLYVIVENGNVVVSKCYSWDGCSPKFFKLGKYYVGTPDGLKDETKWASLIHDVLYQFRIGGFLVANTIFRNELLRVKWKLTELYYLLVSTVGWLWWVT